MRAVRAIARRWWRRRGRGGVRGQGIAAGLSELVEAAARTGTTRGGLHGFVGMPGVVLVTATRVDILTLPVDVRCRGRHE